MGTRLGSRVALIDTEHGSASKYAGLFQFDTCFLDNFNPENYISAIKAAEGDGYDVVILDSMSHAWNGVGGALEMVDSAVARSKSSNSFAAWREVTPVHTALVEAILQSKCHIIATMRSKMEYVIEPNERGRMAPRKVGMAPIQREGMEYEFDVVGDLDLENRFAISKTRCPELNKAVIEKPGEQLAKTLMAWLSIGEKAEPGVPQPVVSVPPHGNNSVETPVRPNQTPALLRSDVIERLKKVSSQPDGLPRVKDAIKTVTGKDSFADVQEIDYPKLLAHLGA